MAEVQIEYRTAWDTEPRITRFAADVTRTWVLNDIGTASFTLAVSTPNFAAITAPGNIIRIQQQGIPAWVGQIRRRTWAAGQLVCDLRSAEVLLTKKPSKQQFKFEGPAGLLALALQQSGAQPYVRSPVKGGIFDATTQHFVTWHYKDVYDGLKYLTESGTTDFWVDDQLRLNVRNQRGLDKRSSVLLREGIDLFDVSFAEDFDEVVTAVVALGDGADVQSKPIRLLELPQPSFWNAALVEFKGIALTDSGASLLDPPATAYLRAHAGPKITIDATTHSSNAARFFVGDTIRVLVYAGGAKEYVARVIGLELGVADTMRCILSVQPPVSVTPPNSWQIGN